MGEEASTAVAEIEAEDLTASFEEEPTDPDLCTVEDQSEVGEVEPGTEVVLTLQCLVEVPDVRGETAEDAQSEIEDVDDLTVSFDPEEPDDLAACMVDDQDEEGAVEPGTEVILTITCPITEEEAEAAAESLAEKTAEVDEDWDVGSCLVLADDEAECDVDYYHYGKDIQCSGAITVHKTDDEFASEQDVDCY